MNAENKIWKLSAIGTFAIDRIPISINYSSLKNGSHQSNQLASDEIIHSALFVDVDVYFANIIRF